VDLSRNIVAKVSAYVDRQPVHLLTKVLKEPIFIMVSSVRHDKDSKNNEVTSTTADDSATDVAVGSMEEHRPYTVSIFFRSVLFQMIMFGT
jgi:hypothetical protein